jgi:hypothetical protein
MPVKIFSDFSGGKTDFPIDAQDNQFEVADNFFVNQYSKAESRPGVNYRFPDSQKLNQPRVVTNSPRVNGMTYIESGLTRSMVEFVATVQAAEYFNGTAWAGLTSNQYSTSPFACLPVGGLERDAKISFAKWNNHTFFTHNRLPACRSLPMKLFNDATGTVKMRVAGLIPTANTFTATGGSGATYIYALVNKYTYSVNSVEYIDRSRPTFKEFTGIGTITPGASPAITVGSIPNLLTAVGTYEEFKQYKYPASELKVEIYRTRNGGTTLYYVGEVTTGTTSFADTVSDETLDNNAVLYTDGGVLSNDRAPKTKYVHGTDNFVFWANGYEVSPLTGEDGELKTNRMWQSKAGDGDSVPGSFFVDIDEDITGLSSVNSIPIVFGENSVYRIDGTFDDFGRGGMVRRKISDGVGAIGNASITQTENGLYFAGNDGFYFTDGYKVYPLSNMDFEESYRGLITTRYDKENLSGVHDVTRNRVLWFVRDSVKPGQMAFVNIGGSTVLGYENNEVYCMDKDTRKFTTWSSGYYGLGPSITINTATTTKVQTLGSTAGIEAGDLVYGAIDQYPFFNCYQGRVVTVDSSTQITLDFVPAIGSYELITNTPDARYYKNFFITAAAISGEKTVVFWNYTGTLLTFDEDVVADVIVEPQDNSSTAAVERKQIAINHYFSGVISSLGSTAYRKWVHGFVLKSRARTNLSSVFAVTPYSENDENNYLQEMKQMVNYDMYPWGTPLVSYGDPRLWRRRQQIFDVKRRCPKASLRCEYKQFHFTNASIVRFSSESLGTATLGAVGVDGRRTLTLNEVTNSWHTDVENNFITFEVDGYVQLFPVMERTSDTALVILDGAGVIAAGSDLSFRLQGFPYNQFFYLVEYGVFFETIGPSQEPYRGDVGT